MTVPAQVLVDDENGTSPGPFEGPEKLLEVWFAPSFDALPEPSHLIKKGLSRRNEPISSRSTPSGSTFSSSHNAQAGCSGRFQVDEVPSGQLQSLNLNSANGAHGNSESGPSRYRGLRTVPKEVWEEMLDRVRCKVLSVVEGDELDAYLLR